MYFSNTVDNTSKVHNNQNSNPNVEVSLDQSGIGCERINSLKLYIPNKIDIDEILEENPPTFKFHKDHFVYILHSIISLSSKKRDEIDKYNGFVPLNAQILQKRNHEYKKYLKYLLYRGVILCDGNYIPKEKSRGYKIADEYQSEIKPVEITKWTLIKSIIHKSSHNKQLTESLPYLKKWFNPKLTVDIISAKKYLKSECRKEKRCESTSENADIRYNARLYPVLKIHEKDYIFKVDNSGDRLHTNISQTKSELRKFIKYDDKKLCAVDITNSQPYMTTALLNKEVFIKNNIQDKIINPNVNKSPIMLVDLIADVENKPDVIEYKKMVASGKFYEEFGKMLIDEKIIEVEKDMNVRKIAKDITFVTLFSPNTSISYQDSMKVFKSKFPNVYRVFKFIKKGRKKHNSLAISLQRLEAELVLHKACKIINRLRPNIPLFTLHDSIITTEDNVRFVRNILYRVLKKQIGTPPKLKIEKWE